MRLQAPFVSYSLCHQKWVSHAASASAAYSAYSLIIIALSAPAALFAALLGRLSSSHFFIQLKVKICVFFTAVQHCQLG